MTQLNFKIITKENTLNMNELCWLVRETRQGQVQWSKAPAIG